MMRNGCRLLGQATKLHVQQMFLHVRCSDLIWKLGGDRVGGKGPFECRVSTIGPPSSAIFAAYLYTSARV